MESIKINPHIRYIDKVTIPQAYPKQVLAYDFRMFYIVKGALEFELSDHRISAYEGDLLTIPPATAYRLIYGKTENIAYYILNFDFFAQSAEYIPRPPVSAERFSKDKVYSYDFYGSFGEVFIKHNVCFAEHILDEIFSFNDEQSEEYRILQSALMKQLIAKITIMDKEEKTETKNSGLTENIKKYINENYYLELTNKSVAKQFGYHPHHLNSIFLETEKITLHKYIDKVRLKYARNMLIHSECSIGDIAEKCGFGDSSYFSKFFLKYMSITPKEYRNLAR